MSFKQLLKEFDLEDFATVNCGEFEITVRRMDFSNQLYRRAARDFLKSEMYGQLEVASTKEDEEGDYSDYAIGIFCYTTIDSWRGVVNDEGVEINFDPQTAFDLLSKSGRAGHILYDKLRQVASRDAHFKDVAAKN